MKIFFLLTVLLSRKNQAEQIKYQASRGGEVLYTDVMGLDRKTTAEEVEEQVAKPLERFLFTYREVYRAKTTTTAQNGMCIVMVRLGDATPERRSAFVDAVARACAMYDGLDAPSAKFEATAGDASAGIGSGASQTGVATCGNITITSGVTSVTAKKSVSDLGPNSIGAGRYGTCGTVTIGDTKYWENNAYVNGGNIYLTTSPIIYPAS